jgi:hypothetical protein
MKLVKVKWQDSCGSTRYWDPGVEKPDNITTVGYLHKKTKNELVIMQSKGEDSLGGVMVIPRSTVKSIKRLK